MKKLILLCFLASLCLHGSEIRAQSRVAESPIVGADLLHRSRPTVPHGLRDTHRGGDARPDTLPEQSERATTSVADTLPAIIYVEILGFEPMDSIEFRIWDPYLNELGIPKPVEEFVPLSKGSMFEGAMGATVAQWESPPIAGYARYSLRKGKFTFVDRFLVQPGDSVRIKIDFQTARVLFAGPSAQKFRIQYELANAMENDSFGHNPVMYGSTSDFWGYSEEDSLKIAAIKMRSSSIRRSMEYVGLDESGLEYLEKKFAEDVDAHPAFEVLGHYQHVLPGEFLQILKADVLGKLYHDQVSAFSALFDGEKYAEKFQKIYRDYIGTTVSKIPEGAEWSVYFPEYLYQKLVITSVMEQEPLRNLLPSLPAAVRDLVDAKYIIKNYTRFRDSNYQFDLALERITAPWVHHLIGSLYSAQRIGEPLAAIPLMTTDGDSTVLGAADGKIRFLHFWLPGCEASSGAYKYLVSPAEEHFKGDQQVEFVYISHDSKPERWLSNIQSGDFATGSALNLNAPGTGHPFLKYYNIHLYPSYMVLGRDGNVVNVGNVPTSPEGLIRYLESLKLENSPTP